MYVLGHSCAYEKSAFGLQVQTEDVIMILVGSATHKSLAKDVSQNENINMSSM